MKKVEEVDEVEGSRWLKKFEEVDDVEEVEASGRS